MLKHVYTLACLLLGGLLMTANAEEPVPVQVLPEGVVANVTGNRWSVKEKNMVVAGNATKGYEAYFAATDTAAADVEQLWKTNGAELATKVSSFSNEPNIKWMARFNDKVVFQALGALYISDGAAVTEIKVGEASLADPMGFTQINEYYFIFTAKVGENYQLFRSNGEIAELIYADDEAGFSCVFPGEFHGDDMNAPWCRVGRKVYFKATTTAAGQELWITDGNKNTYMVKDINAGEGNAAVTKMVNVDNKYLVFKAYSDTTRKNFVWYSDGTEAGTQMFTAPDFVQNDNTPRNIAVMNGKAYAGMKDLEAGIELVVLDPATGKGKLLKDFNEGSGDSWPDVLSPFEGQMMVIANAGGCNIFSVTEKGKATKGNWNIAFPDNGYAQVNGSYITYGLYTATGGDWGLYRIDSVSGLANAKPIYKGVASGTSSDGKPCGYALRPAGNKLFFSATIGDWAHVGDNRGVFCYQYCKEGGVAESLEINYGSNKGPHIWDEAPKQLLPEGVVANVTGNRWSVKEKNIVVAGSPAAGYEAYFAASDADGEQLWKTNGDKLASKVSAFTDSAAIKWLARFNDKVVFQALGALYISDGAVVNEIKCGEASLVDPMGFTQFNENYFIFTAKVGENYQLYRSNGEIAELIYADDEAGFSCVFPGEFHGDDMNAPWCRVGRKVYFKASTTAEGQELWITNGTTKGTYMVKDINVGEGGSAVTKMVNVNNQYLVFKAWNVEHENFIWYSDGTEAGTQPFDAPDLVQTANVPRNMAVMNGKVYTGMKDLEFGNELCAFDPATGKGKVIKDFNEGSGDSWPDVLSAYEGQMITVANAGGCNIFAVTEKGKATKGGWQIAFPDGGYAIVNGTFYGYGLYPARGGDWGVYAFDSIADMKTATPIYNGVTSGNSSDGIPCGYSMRPASNKLFFAVTTGDWAHTANNRGVFCYTYCKEGGVAENLEPDFGKKGPHEFDEAPKQVLPEGVVANVTGNRWKVKEKNMVIAGNPTKGYEAYFAATDTAAADVEQLWKTNGGAKASKVSAFTEEADIKWLARFNDKVVFQAFGALYISDGAAVTEIKAGEASLIDPMGFTQINETQFIFTAKVDSLYHLYVSDGVSATSIYSDNEAGFSCVFPGEFHTDDMNAPWCRVGRKVYFKASTTAEGQELWITNGTKEGTYMVKDINVGEGNAAVTKMVNVDNKYLVFKAWDEAHSNFVWYSDGTEEGTKAFDAKDLVQTDNTPRNMAVMNGKVYTGMKDIEFGSELVALDPATGTGKVVKDFNEGSGDSWPDVLSAYEGQMITIANAGGCNIYAVTEKGKATKGNWQIAFPDGGYAIVNGTFYGYGLYPARGGDWGLYAFDNVADMPTATPIYNGVTSGNSSDGIPCGYTMGAASNKLFFAVTTGDWAHTANNRGVFYYEYCKEGGEAEDLEIDFGPLEKEYYLVGWINGAAYGIEGDIDNFGDYKFVDGEVSATFNEKSYVIVKDQTKTLYYVEAWHAADPSKVETLKSNAGWGEKIEVNGNVKLNFTLVENEDGSLTLSYEEEGTGLKSVNAQKATINKMIIDGRVVIMVNGVRYNVLGAQIQ